MVDYFLSYRLHTVGTPKCDGINTDSGRSTAATRPIPTSGDACKCKTYILDMYYNKLHHANETDC